MRNSFAFRISAHTCIFFSVFAMTELFKNSLWLLFAVAALILAADLAALQIDRFAPRLALSLVPAVLLIFAPSLPSAALLAVPVAYSAALTAAGRFKIELWRLRSEAKIILLLLFVVSFASGMRFFTTLFGEFDSYEPVYCTWAFVLLTALLLFMMLRAARSGNVRSAGWQARNVLYFLIPVAAAVPLALFAIYGFVPVFKVVGMIICAPLFVLLVVISKVFEWIYSFGKYVQDPEVSEPPTTYLVEEDFEDIDYSGEELDVFRSLFHFKVSRETLIIIGSVVLAAIVIFIAVKLIMLGRRGTDEYMDKGGAEASFEGEMPERKRRRRHKKEQSMAERVRFVYRQYLSFLRIHGIIPERSRTTGEISEEAREVLLETDDMLRELYRKARYGREKEITEEDVRMAEKAYERLVNNDNIRKIKDDT